MKPVEISLREDLLELIRRASTQLPADVTQAVQNGLEKEQSGEAAASALKIVLENIELAAEQSTPICQDTGTPIFVIHHPFGYSQRAIAADVEWAVIAATEHSYLRPNAVDSVTGKNSGNNIGIGLPSLHFQEWEREEIKIDLLLKGGGCENVGAQYALPYSPLGAGRDLAGVRKVVLDAVFKAQGRGCGPAIIGVGIGGDRTHSAWVAKEQFFRPLSDTNEDGTLAELEQQLFEEGNRLGIGPMGFGGATTLLGVKIGVAHRLPASFFVSVSYLCWAARRSSLTVNNGEVTFA
jgi:fumarate hydratase, class I